MMPVLICEYIIGDETVMRLSIVNIEEKPCAISRFGGVLTQDICCDHLRQLHKRLA
jgi:hypothetical protein